MPDLQEAITRLVDRISADAREFQLLEAERNIYWNALRAIEREDWRGNRPSHVAAARLALDIGEDARRGKFVDAPR